MLITFSWTNLSSAETFVLNKCWVDSITIVTVIDCSTT